MWELSLGVMPCGGLRHSVAKLFGKPPWDGKCDVSRLPMVSAMYVSRLPLGKCDVCVEAADGKCDVCVEAAFW